MTSVSHVVVLGPKQTELPIYPAIIAWLRLAAYMTISPHALLAMTVVHLVSCLRGALVESESAVTGTTPLCRILVSMTLPDFPALALLMA